MKTHRIDRQLAPRVWRSMCGRMISNPDRLTDKAPSCRICAKWWRDKADGD